jgi:hypothetical protein
MGALRDAFEKGGRSRWGVETNPIFQRWTNDPQFMELIMEMKQEATRLRSLLEASDEVALISAGGVNG